MDNFLHDIIHILGDLEMAVERAMKQLKDVATKKAIEDAEKGTKGKDDEK